ncbi:MAG: sigma 54-interacting transcriptional regulator [Polyangiaceae bacterium]|nr:sigma 54-interacting transcriptional regulator [Polyangiaceae bacterium]
MSSSLASPAGNADAAAMMAAALDRAEMTAGNRRTPKARESSIETAPLEAPVRAVLVVFVVDGAGPPVRIDRSLRVGRDSSCEVHVDDESVSRVHAIIEPGDPPTIHDAASRNGTSVGGRRLEEDERAGLAAGTLVTIGAVRLLVDWERVGRATTQIPDVAGIDVPRSGPMVEVFSLAERLASDDITVLLTGETGVGKEVVAHYLHARSPRSAGPFVPVHAAALTASLFESELFGYERGAFTGATGEREGLFEAADGGTLFFDEIGELPLEMQPKLLRVLEDRRVTRVGGRSPRTVDVRILAATNRDLAGESARGRFRSDLYFRLSGFPIAIPPLRERQGEIPSLAEALLASAARERGRPAPEIAPDAIARLVSHDWPGNVRELRSTMTRALLFLDAKTPAIDRSVVERALGQGAASRVHPSAPAEAASASDSDPERRRIVEALARHAGNQAAAAAELGIARRTLLYKLDRLGIPRPRKGRG